MMRYFPAKSESDFLAQYVRTSEEFDFVALNVRTQKREQINRKVLESATARLPSTAPPTTLLQKIASGRRLHFK